MSFDTPGYVDAEDVCADLRDIATQLEYIDCSDDGETIAYAIGDVIDELEVLIRGLEEAI